MKKKNLNFLLALLAALALVFAGACSDGSDGSDDSGDSPSSSNDSPSSSGEPTVTYTTYTYPGDDTTHTSTATTYLGPVSLTFADFSSDVDSGNVAISVQYVTCTTAGDKKGEGGQSACTNNSGESISTCILYTWSSTGATYSYTAGTDGGSDTVTVYLPESDDSPTAVTGAYLTLTVGTGADAGKLTLTEAKKDASNDLSQYTVKGNDGTNDDSTGCDILSSDSTTGALTASESGSEFTLDAD